MNSNNITLLFMVTFFLLIPLKLVQANPSNDHVPIIFIHGYNSGGAAWKGTDFKERMESRLGRENIYFVEYDEHSRNDITSEAIQDEFKEVFEEAQNNHNQVDVVAHSMGGLGVRWF